MQSSRAKTTSPGCALKLSLGLSGKTKEAMHEVEEGVHLLLRENGLVVADEEEASVHARIVNCATGLLLALARPILLDEGPDIDHRQRVEAPPRFSATVFGV